MAPAILSHYSLAVRWSSHLRWHMALEIFAQIRYSHWEIPPLRTNAPCHANNPNASATNRIGSASSVNLNRTSLAKESGSRASPAGRPEGGGRGSGQITRGIRGRRIVAGRAGIPSAWNPVDAQTHANAHPFRFLTAQRVVIPLCMFRAQRRTMGRIIICNWINLNRITPINTRPDAPLRRAPAEGPRCGRAALLLGRGTDKLERREITIL